MINKMDLNNKAISIRHLLCEDELSPIDIFSLSQTIQTLSLVFYPLGKNISGACFKNQLSSIIAINSDMSIGRQRYTLAHELYHLYFDEEDFTTICSSKIDEDSENEKKANQFASYFLMPSAALYESIQKLKNGINRQVNIEEIIRLEQYFGVSHQVMLIRLQEEGEISSAIVASMQTGIISLAARLGYDVSLYKPSAENKKMCVYGHYIYQAENLYKHNLISNGKYEELLLDAFRSDIVFGEETERGAVLD